MKTWCTTLISLATLTFSVFAQANYYYPQDRAFCIPDHIEQIESAPSKTGFDFRMPGARIQVVDAGCKPLRTGKVTVSLQATAIKTYAGGCNFNIGLAALPMWNTVAAFPTGKCWSGHESASTTFVPMHFTGTAAPDENGNLWIPSTPVFAGENYFHPVLTVEVFHVGNKSLQCSWKFEGQRAIQKMPQLLICQNHPDPDPWAVSRVEHVTLCSQWLPPWGNKPAIQTESKRWNDNACSPVIL